MEPAELARFADERPRARMVGWFDPQVLAQTALHMATANIFGRHSDARLIEALANQPQGVFDYTQAASADDDGVFWLDYVSDVGDGWNPTYAIARARAQPGLALDSPDGGIEHTRSGQVLVFGGDAVYPYPTRAAYVARTEYPYAAAMRGSARRPDLYAIPGNHDWFDSLVAFSRLFCRPDRGFAGCRTRQTRSYCALQLPHHWWLVAIDLQLGAEIDEPQMRYLEEVAAHMQPEDRLILCVPEPQWLYEAAYPDHAPYAAHVLKALETQVFRRTARLMLTGDLHHYQRHSNDAGMHKVVAGGGGAFLHPTHASPAESLPHGFVRAAAYPDPATSSRLTWRNLLLAALNPRCLVIPAVLYLLSAWFASASLEPLDVQDFGSALAGSLNAALRDPVNGLWLLAFIAAFVFFTDTHVRWYRFVAGGLHAVAHLAAAFVLAWLTLVLTTRVLALEYGSGPQLLISGVLLFAAGGVIGATLLGIYLLVSLQCFGRHSNEAFSALRVQDYKQWLRLRIDADGSLTCFAIGIDRVPRHWRRSESAEGSLENPDDPRTTAPRLIDRFEVR